MLTRSFTIEGKHYTLSIERTANKKRIITMTYEDQQMTFLLDYLGLIEFYTKEGVEHTPIPHNRKTNLDLMVTLIQDYFNLTQGNKVIRESIKSLMYQLAWS